MENTQINKLSTYALNTIFFIFLLIFGCFLSVAILNFFDMEIRPTEGIAILLISIIIIKAQDFIFIYKFLFFTIALIFYIAFRLICGPFILLSISYIMDLLNSDNNIQNIAMAAGIAPLIAIAVTYVILSAVTKQGQYVLKHKCFLNICTAFIMLIIFFIFYFYSQKYNRKEVFNEVPTGTYFLLILILNLFFACLVLKFKKPYYKLTTQKFIFYFIPAFIFSFVIQINRFRLDIQEYEYETLAGFLTPVAVFICAVIFKLRNIQKNWQSTKITRIGIIISCISIPLLILGFIFYIDNGYYYWDKSKSYMNYFDYDYSFGILNLLGIILLFLGLTLFSGIYDRIYKWVKTGE